MDYRDEREALRQRADSLEQALADARRSDDKGGRIRAIEQRMAEAQREIDRLAVELRALGGGGALRDPRGGVTFGPIAAGVAMLLAGAAGGLVFASRRSRSSAPQVVVTVPGPPAPPPVQEAVDPQPPVPTASAAPELPPPPAPPRQTTARWTGRVVRATGGGPAAGSACTVDADLEAQDSKVQIADLTVSCGGKPLYRSADELRSGIAMTDWTVQEDLDPADGTSHFVVKYQDTGTRSGPRSQVSLSTLKSVGEVWSDTAPSFRVAMNLAVYSQPILGEPFSDLARKGLREGYSVEEASPSAPVKVGAVCRLVATPMSQKDCWVHLLCGGKVLYGAGTSGLTACTVGPEMMTAATDDHPSSKDGDPEIRVDVRAGTIALGDDRPTSWSITLRRRGTQ